MTRVSAMPQDAFAPDSPNEEASGSLWNVVRDAMAGRWLYAAILGIVLGGGLATAGFLMTEPEYTAVAYIQVSSRTDYVLEDIQEHRLADVDAFVNQQARLMQNHRVLSTAIGSDFDLIGPVMSKLSGGSDKAGPYIPDQTLSDLGWRLDDGLSRYRANLGIRTGRRDENLITISYSSPIADEAHAAVASLVAAYQESYGQVFSEDISRRIGALESQKERLEVLVKDKRESRAGTLNGTVLLGNPRRANERAHDRLERIDDQIDFYDRILKRRQTETETEAEEPASEAADELDELETTDPSDTSDTSDTSEATDAPGAPGADTSAADGTAPDAENDAEEPPTPFDSTREPTNRELDQFDPLLGRQRAEVELLRQNYEDLKANYSPGFWRLDDALIAWTRAQSDFETKRFKVIERWRDEQERLASLQVSDGGFEPTLPETSSTDEIRAALGTLNEARDGIIAEISRISRFTSDVEQLEAEILDLEGQLDVVAERLSGLKIETNADFSAISRRITVTPAEEPRVPSSDKRRKLAAVGLMGGLGVGFGLFFVLGTLDRRAFDSTQLRGKEHRRPFLGTIPDMEQRVDDEVDANALAASCVHQVRNRIDAVRSADEGLVLAVSSPQQGDGKTSVAVALGHSYARAGFSTILVDCDLIGEGLSLAMGLRDRVGIRESLLAGRITNEIVADVAANLSVLPCGSTRGFGPESVRRASLMNLIRELRSVYDVVIVDSGPMPGSIESIPVAMSVDGVVVVIRRGRQQSVLDSCIESIESTGTPCFGVVLNRARPSDCERMVSASAISLPVEESRKRRLVLAGGAGEKLTSALGSEGDDFAEFDGDDEGPR
ncbi:MAG: hypothetical protein AB8G96_10655 [Phycisphaerales bacterium]